MAEVPVVEGGVDEQEQEQGLEDQDLIAGETLAQEEGLVVREDQEGRGEGEVVEEDRSSDLSNGAMIPLGQVIARSSAILTWASTISKFTWVVENTGILIP